MQVAKEAQGSGVGKRLINILELFGQKWGMEKIMLTALLGRIIIPPNTENDY